MFKVETYVIIFKKTEIDKTHKGQYSTDILTSQDAICDIFVYSEKSIIPTKTDDI